MIVMSAIVAIPQRFSIPSNDDEFEQMCLELLRPHWSRPGLELFGKRGERQYGIDILDLGGEVPLYAAQCKLKEEHKSLQPAEIHAEVEKAKTFVSPLGKYAILTTGKVSTPSQLAIREINQSHKANGLFEVELFPWEKLCLLLQHYEDVQERFYGGIGVDRAAKMDANILHIKDGVDSLTSKNTSSEIDSKINEARDCITQKDFQVATLLLNRIQRSGQELSARQQFRVLANHGAAALGIGKGDDAARFFLEAVSLQPDDEQGRINEVLAYLLIGDLAASHSKATLLRQQYPASARLAALWVTTSPETVTLAEIEATDINSVLRTDPEVSVALARKGLRSFDFDKASIYANSAVKALPQWAQTHLTVAEIAVGRALHLQSGPIRDAQTSLLHDALNSCSKAVEVARAEKDVSSEVASLVARVNVLLLMNESSDAVRDAEEATALDPDDSRVLLALGQVRLARKQIDEGISLLARAHTINPHFDVAFVYGKALYDRGKEGDLDAALRVFRDLSIQALPIQIRVIIVTQIIQCFAKRSEWPEALSYLDQVSEFLDPVAVKILRGYLAHYRGLRVEAEQYAAEALSALPADAGSDTKEVLARLFGLVGRQAEALPLWQSLFDLDQPSFDAGNLLACAARLHRDDIVLKTCEQLHARGLADWHLLEFEIQYLQKYQIDVAIERLQAFIATHPEHKLAVLRLSMIGVLLDRPDLVRADLEHLPDVNKLPLEYIIPAVHVLRFGAEPAAAVDYSYRFLREHFSDIQAHQALLMSMMPGFDSPDIPPSLDVVAPDSAVCYQEGPTGVMTWVVLEATQPPKSDFEEISLTSPLAEAFIGKRVGDTAIFAKGRMQDRTATILQIVPKQVRRYQDSMMEMQVRFGAASPVESVQFGSPEDPSAEKGLEILIAWAKQRADVVTETIDIYRKVPISLHLLGTRFGQNAYAAIYGLAHDQTQQVKCSLGAPGEHAQALQSLQTAKALVVDLTAIATLRMLGLTKVLSSSKYKFIVSQQTRITLHEMLSRSKVLSVPGATLLYEEGGPQMYPKNAEEEEQWQRADAEICPFCRKQHRVP